MSKLDIFVDGLKKLQEETGGKLVLNVYKSVLTEDTTTARLFVQHENIANVIKLIEVDVENGEWRKEF